MRCLLSVAVVCLVAGPAVRADDPPEGSIGIMIKVEDGKVVIVEPIKDSPADKAGIKTGDVVVKINEVKVSADDLKAIADEIGKHKPGEKIKVTVNRDGKDMAIEVTVGKRSEIFPKK
jgi:carboxyl-terminal processing protease